ncbi:hypothetical protein C8R45DRAFT_1182864 [Mycena sanguinolenta]|nr:hypothetical protein C8R45DRAFT_1182864 [Mycena sanguinolenta]
MTRPIVVGGGLAGLSAAHTVLGRVTRSTLVRQSQASKSRPNYLSLGGNSVKASSGINDVVTKVQGSLGDASIETLYRRLPGHDLTRAELIAALTANSASVVAWFTKSFDIDLSVVSHCEESACGEAAGGELAVMDVTYEVASGTRAEGKGATSQLLPRWPPRTPLPAVLPLATTNGDHATSDGMHLVLASRAAAAVCYLARASVDLFVALARRMQRRPRAPRLENKVLRARRGRIAPRRPCPSKNLMVRYPYAAAVAEDNAILLSRRLRPMGRTGMLSEGGIYIDDLPSSVNHQPPNHTLPPNRSASRFIASIVHYIYNGRPRCRHLRARHALLLFHHSPHAVDSKPVGHGINYPRSTQAGTIGSRVRGRRVVVAGGGGRCLGGLRERGPGCGGGVNSEGNYDEGAKGSVRVGSLARKKRINVFL